MKATNAFGVIVFVIGAFTARREGNDNDEVIAKGAAVAAKEKGSTNADTNVGSDGEVKEEASLDLQGGNNGTKKDAEGEVGTGEEGKAREGEAKTDGAVGPGHGVSAVARPRANAASQNHTQGTLLGHSQFTRQRTATAATGFLAMMGLAEAFHWACGNPDAIVTVGFTVVCSFALLGTLIARSSDTISRIGAMRDQRLMLQAAFTKAIEEMEKLLKNMTASTAVLVERNFVAKSRSFQRFLDHSKRDAQDSNQVSGGAYGDVFRWFVGIWLSVFEQCSLDPVNMPHRIVTKVELAKCLSVEQVVDLVLPRLEQDRFHFVSASIKEHENAAPKQAPSTTRGGPVSWLQFSLYAGFSWKRMSLDDDEDYPAECRCGFVTMTIVSSKHVRYIEGILIGIAIIVWEVYLMRAIYIALASIAELFLLLTLIIFDDIDQLAQLTYQIQQLAADHNEAQAYHVKVNKFHDQTSELIALWRCQTLPRLENLKELHERLRDGESFNKIAYLHGLCTKLALVDSAVGPLALWIGSKLMDAALLEMMAEQMSACTEKISQTCVSSSIGKLGSFGNTLMQVGNMFGFVYIQILAAHSLTNKSKIGSNHPYVCMKLNSMESEMHTNKAALSLDPVWDGEEFFFKALPDDSELILHVWHNDSSMGYLKLEFRQLQPGVLHQKRMNLISLKKSTEKKSELSFVVYFANTLEQLGQQYERIRRAKQCDAREDAGLSSGFLGRSFH